MEHYNYKYLNMERVNNTSRMFSEFSNGGLTGLANVGNTCYLNSCIQILSHTHELSKFLNTKTYKQKLNNKPESLLLVEWDKLREMMWSSNCTIGPYGFVKSVQKISMIKNMDLFSGYQQNDIQEFLLFLIDCFHEALARPVNMTITGNVKNSTDILAKKCYTMMKNMYKKEYSELLGIFYGIHVSVVTSLEDNTPLSTRPEPFSVITLSIPSNHNNITIYDCFDYYCKKESLINENQYDTDNGNKIDAERGIVFWSLPDILIINLKRWNPHNGNKINTLIHTPLNDINLSKYVMGYNAKDYIYDLYGVCNHLGNSLGGHYIACVKNANGKWYEFNDTNVIEFNENKVVSSNNYCLFYRKKK